MKVKDIIISTVVAVAAVAMTVGAAIMIKGQIYKNAIKSAVCKYDKTLQNESVDKIIVGMLACPKERADVSSIIAVPPTTDEASAYLSACACWENDNPADGRVLKAFVPVYATGKISKEKIYSDNNSDIKDAKNLGTFEFAFWDSKREKGVKQNITIKSSGKTDILEKCRKAENAYAGNNGGIPIHIELCGLLTKDKDGCILGRGMLSLPHSITQPTNIYEIYGDADLSKICKEAYNPTARVQSKDLK